MIIETAHLPLKEWKMVRACGLPRNPTLKAPYTSFHIFTPLDEHITFFKK
jgi:hypothetical protein